MNDYDIHDGECPECGSDTLHSRGCQNFACEMGMIDEHHDDPVNFAPGSFLEICRDCYGTEVEIWCPKCGCDVTKHRFISDELKLPRG